MSKKTKFDGIKDDLDVVAIAKAFVAFTDEVQLISDRADSIEVDLPFETSFNSSKHYSFQQDDIISISGVKFHPDTSKIMFSVPFGAEDKYFYLDELDIIMVYTMCPTNGRERESLADAMKKAFAKTFVPELKINSITALQAMAKNNPGLPKYLNDVDKFLEVQDVATQRTTAYAKLKNYGRY